MYYLLLPDLEKRTAFIAKLKENHISTVFHYVPLDTSPMGKQCARVSGELTHTHALSDRLVRLPLWLGLEERLAEVIAQVISAAE